MARSNTPKMTRAEQVRQRQNERSQKRSTPSRVSPPRKSTPLQTRGVVNGFNYARPAQQRVKKQYYYSVGATGTEIRMPAIPTIKFGWRLLSFILAGIFIALLYFMFNAPFLQVNAYQLNGISRVTEMDIDAELGLLGKSIVYANPNKAISTISAAFPELYDISFTVTMPNQVRINANERTPVMGWQTPDRLYWVDQTGVLIPPRGEAPEMLTIQAENDPAVMIVLQVETEKDTNNSDGKLESDKNDSKMGLTAPVWGDQIDPVTIKAAYQLQTHIPAGTAIIFDKDHGMGWRAAEGWDVFIGLTLNDIEYKLKAYNILITKLNNEGITPSMVSIEYLHAPFYRE